MDRQEWLEWRRGGIGSSDVPVILGSSPKGWGTPFSIWEEKVLGKERSDNASMRFGRENEEAALKAFEEYTGLSMASQIRKEHVDFPWLRATLDGIDFDGKTVVEIKCANEKDHQDAVNKKIPSKYYPQVQHQMNVVGLESMAYWSFHKGKGALVEVERDDSHIKETHPILKAFWDLVLSKTPPEGYSDVVDVGDMSDHPEWCAVSSEWKEVYAQLKILEEREDVLRRSLISLAGEKNTRGNGVRLIKTNPKGVIDYSQIPELKDVDLEKYRKLGVVRYTMKIVD